MIKNKLFVLVGILLILSTVFVACVTSTTTSTQSTTKPSTSATTSTITTSTVSTQPTSKQTNWWDKFGMPQYGGELVMRTTRMDQNFDAVSNMNFADYWMETLWVEDWTLDRNTWSFKLGNFVPGDYHKGNLAKSWSWTDATTLTINLRQGVRWQNISPVNGREFTAEDVVFTWDRMMGTGHGYTEPNPMYGRFVSGVKKVSAPDQYTVVFEFSDATPATNMQTVYDKNSQYFEAPEVAALSPVNDWHLGIGTGPYMLKEYVSGSSMTLDRNPDYWGYDERYPENKLPYIDTVKSILLDDNSTTIAALRTGKIDYCANMDLIMAQTLAKSNPEIVQDARPSGSASLQLRNDNAPFTDIKVRKALQMAINIPEIAKTYFGGYASEEPIGTISPEMKGYCYPYSEWSQSLKDEYSYNPSEAKELLKEAGYSDGFKTNVVFTPSMVPSALLEIVKSYFNDINVDIEIVSYPDMPALDAVISKIKHDQMVALNTAGTMPPYLTIKFQSPSDPFNWLRQEDTVYEDLVTQLGTAKTEADLQRICKSADERYIEGHWAIVLPFNYNYSFWQPYLKGYSGEVGTGAEGNILLTPYFYAARLWIDQTQK